MGSKITLKIQRSAEWVAAQRLDRGENVREVVEVEVDPADLSQEVRKVLLDSNPNEGSYSHFPQIEWTESYISRGETYNCRRSVPIVMDGDSPADVEISAAILAAVETGRRLQAENAVEMAAKRVAYEEGKAAKEAEKVAREKAITDARELLAPELAELTKLGDLQSKLKTLAEFLAEIPPDAKRGALRRMAAVENANTEESLREKIEDASPIWVLKDLDDEDE